MTPCQGHAAETDKVEQSFTIKLAKDLADLQNVPYLGALPILSSKEILRLNAMCEPNMAEVERLLEAYEHEYASGGSVEDYDRARAALLDYVRGILAERDALIADNERLMQIAMQESDVGARVLREVFALCEDTQDKCSEDANDFTRGRRFEAKGIARAIGTWYQDEFCGRTRMGGPDAAANEG